MGETEEEEVPRRRWTALTPSTLPAGFAEVFGLSASAEELELFRDLSEELGEDLAGVEPTVCLFFAPCSADFLADIFLGR